MPFMDTVASAVSTNIKEEDDVTVVTPREENIVPELVTVQHRRHDCDKERGTSSVPHCACRRTL